MKRNGEKERRSTQMKREKWCRVERRLKQTIVPDTDILDDSFPNDLAAPGPRPSRFRSKNAPVRRPLTRADYLQGPTTIRSTD